MRQANRRRYHYVYKTTCKVTGKYYIGMHSTDNLEDGYVGSGKILWYSINKHGKDNHVCEILEFLPDRITLRLREAALITETCLKDPKCMNIKLGGDGGWDHIIANSKQHSLTSAVGGKKGGAVHRQRCESDPAYKQKYAKSGAKVIREHGGFDKLKEKDPEAFAAICTLATEAAKSEKAKAKRKATFIENNHQQGEKNSQYGSCWISKDGIVIKVSKLRLDTFIADGWNRGRKK